MLNRLRAAVLGANDGIVSTSSVVMGVAGANADNKTIFTAGVAALVAGALSMAVGEYVSVASQRDAEKAHVKKHEAKESDYEFTSPVQAALASFFSFVAGGLIPLIAIVFSPDKQKIWFTVLAVIIALLLTGYFSATAGGASRSRAMFRVVFGGTLAMAITYYVGVAFGAAIG